MSTFLQWFTIGCLCVTVGALGITLYYLSPAYQRHLYRKYHGQPE